MLNMYKLPYSGFCLQGPNYVSCCELANFNSVVTLALSFQLTARVTYSSVLEIILRYVSGQILQKRDTFALLPDLKGQRITMVM